MSSVKNVKPNNKKEKLQRESIKVMIRFRPINKLEKQWNKKNKKININFRDNKIEYLPQNKIKLLNTNGKKYQYSFDNVLTPSNTQRETFEIVAESVCDEILQGYNGTIFVYGQSGSGKTHTMYGPEEKKDEMDISTFGIIPMACAYLFTILNDNTHSLSEDIIDYNVRCEFIEIYNERLRDLLNPKQTPQIREMLINKKYVPVMQNVTTEQVSNLEECVAAIRTATSNRTTARTNLNATSSRSHMVMRLIVTIQTKDGMKKTGIGNFADLAGSEKVKKTGVVGKQLKEAGNILKSLSALSNVIDSLEKGRKHIPFKDSKLTFMLKNSLGGNCKTTLLICASPHIHNRNETVRSMQFGMRCRNVQNVVCINEVRTKKQLILENDRLKGEILALKNNAIASEEIINEKLNEIEMENFDLLKQTESNDKTIDVLRQQIQQMSIDRDQMIEKEKELTNELNIVNNSYKELKTNINHKKDMNVINEYKQELKDYETKIKGINENNINIIKENKKLNMKNKELQTAIKRLKEDIGNKNENINEFEIKYEKLKNENNEQKKHIISIQNDINQKEMLKEEIKIIQKKWIDLKEELGRKDIVIRKNNDLLKEYKELNMNNNVIRHVQDMNIIQQDIIECNMKEHNEFSLKLENMKHELEEEKMKSELENKQYNKLLLKHENIMIELKNEKDKNENLKIKVDKIENKGQVLMNDKYEIEDKYNVILGEYNDLKDKINIFEENIQFEINKYSQNLNRLKTRVEQQRDDNIKLLDKLTNIEKSQMDNDKLEELEIQIEEQVNTIKGLNDEIKKLKEDSDKEASPSVSGSMDSHGDDDTSLEKPPENDEINDEKKQLVDDNKEDEKKEEELDWDFLLNQCHPRTRSSAFVRLPKGFTTNITPGKYTPTRGKNVSTIRVTKPSNGILYDDDGDKSALDQLEIETNISKSNINGIEQYRRKKRKKYSKRNIPKPKQTFDTSELNKYNKLLSPRVSVYQKERKLSKSERIVRQQTLSLGNYFENHLEMQKQKDERMEKIFDAMENSKRKASAIKKNIKKKGNKSPIPKESDTIVFITNNNKQQRAISSSENIPKSWDDTIYDNPIQPIKNENKLEKLKNIEKEIKDVWVDQIANNNNKMSQQMQQSQSNTNLYTNNEQILQQIQHSQSNTNLYNNMNGNLGMINRSASLRNMVPYHNSNGKINRNNTIGNNLNTVANKHKYSSSQHMLLSQHISDKYHYSYSRHTGEYKKKKKKSKKDRSEETAKLALIYDNEYKAMKRRYQQKKRKRLLSKANVDNITMSNKTNNDQSLAADAYDSDHNDSKNVPL